jgi:hypothetical protein
MIAEAAYYLAQKRGSPGKHSLDDWLAAEQQVRHMISPISDADPFAKAGERPGIASSASVCDEQSSRDPR